MAEVEQFAADAHEPHKGFSLANLSTNSWHSAGSGGRPGPWRRRNADQRRRTRARCQPQDRGRTHQEQGARRKPAAERGQGRAIGYPPARPSSRASHDEQLLAEDEEFEIAIGSLATRDDEQVNQQAEEGIEQGEHHGAASVGPARGAGQAAGRSPAEESAPGWEVRVLPRSGRAVGDQGPVLRLPRPAGRTIKCTPRPLSMT